MKILKTMIGYGAIASLVLAPAAGFAASPEYNYVEASYVNSDVDGVDDGDGFGIAGSAEVGENIFIFGEYSTVGFSGGVDFDVIRAGIGYKSAISGTTDVNLSAFFVNMEIDAGFFGGIDEDGFGLDATLRSMVSNEFEVNGGITYIDLGGAFDDETSIHFGGVYSFNTSFAVVGDIEFGDDITTFSIGGRFYFQ
ncbi:MAG: hypothetical protein V3S53_06190 [Gammaproteobacteria bacterium]